MLHTGLWLRRGLAVVALAAMSAFAVASHSLATPATYPHDGPAQEEAENGDWPW